MRALWPLSLLLACAPLVARADPSETRTSSNGLEPQNESPAYDDWLLRRKHTLAEAEVGMFALPNAPISASQRGGNLPIGTVGHGDATLLTGMHLLYRGGSDWVLGAGALFAPLPTSDDQYGGASGLSRTHARSYLWIGGEARYIPLHYKSVEGWIGVAVGEIVVADRFTTNAGPDVPPVVGTKTVTVSTEGGSVGLQLGGDWLFADRLVLGIAGRLDHWILPTTPTCSAIGDCSTLSGPVSEIEVGLRLGYRLPL